MADRLQWLRKIVTWDEQCLAEGDFEIFSREELETRLVRKRKLLRALVSCISEHFISGLLPPDYEAALFDIIGEYEV